MGDYCSELFTEGGGYFVVIGDLFVIEGYWLVRGNALFLTGHLSNEPEKTSGVLCALTRKDVRCPMCADSVCAGRGWLEQTKLQLTLFCRVWDLRFDLLCFRGGNTHL